MEEIPPLTTGDVAKYCNVNFRTVIRWIDRGILKSYKLPGRGDNRVKPQNLFAFLKLHDMPVPDILKQFERKILIVDDEEFMAKSIQRVLRENGFETEIARDGFSAGSKIETFYPSLITLDLSMPGMSGLEVVQYIKSQERFSHIKIMILSALDQNKIDEAIKAGANDFMCKPFENQDLIKKIAALYSGE